MEITIYNFTRLHFEARDKNDRIQLDRLQEFDSYAYYCANYAYDKRSKRIARQAADKAAGISRKPGRPKIEGLHGKQRCVYINDKAWAALQSVGDGSASAGIRRLLDKLDKLDKQTAGV